MRIDLFLKLTRIIKRRTIAKEFCNRGLVKVNGKIIKPSFNVSSGDQIVIKLGEKEFAIVARIENVGKKQKAFYDEA